MKFTLSWLKDYLDTDAPLDVILEKLTDIGLEVEGVEDRAAQYAPFKVVEVMEAVPHPNADRLRVCQVKTETGMIQVVCGAPNARAGMKAILAPEGSYVPGLDMTMKKTKIRDVESNGMMASEREMNLGDDQNGIIDLPVDTPIGTPLADIYGLNDPIIEINVTPNRPDCAGIRGIARDLAAVGLGTLKPLSSAKIPAKFDTPVAIKLETPACPLFVGRLIKGVKNGPSPEWLQNRLKAIGLRPISALVDITNYFCIGICRPLHVFDADQLKGNITVRFAKTGETFDALNDKSYTLADTMIAVCDDSGVLGLGGIVGGTTTGCSDDTVNVLLECAYFDPLTIARAGRALGVHSDARYRFERGIDPAFTIEAVELATQMILDLCGGEVGSVVQAGTVPPCTKVIAYKTDAFKQLMGYDVPATEQKQILEALGFVVDSSWNVTTPSWRPDVFGVPDLIEEVARMKGLAAIPAVSVLKDQIVAKSAETPRGQKMRKTRNALAAQGLQECVTWSFMAENLASKFGANDATAARLKLVNAISTELVQMRPSILPNLIEASQRNADRGFHNAALFEVGPIFKDVKPDAQPMVAAGIRFGAMGDKHWSGANAARAVDVYDAKADAQRAIEAAGGPSGNLQVSRDAPSYYHPGRSGALRLGANVIGYFGEIHPALLDEMKVSVPVVGFEVFIENIPEPKKKGTSLPLVELSPFQPISRDFAFLADAGVEADSFVKAIKSVDRNLIGNVEIFDIYSGKGIEPGKKSVAISVVIQPKAATLTDAEIEGLSKKIIDIVTQKIGAQLRA
ncbi:MAG: phenylalanine--tRNA ligase subunit beta [Alphaproteobacteria bacterium RIFCSPHIGHO2_12_FULL_45_9]|nr:MAG: phenylalanine--tRNA ligase subunit beta [Alphaproteobacteria bacterium RIFCSPHIGHO2_12_FULL_45_9]